MNNKDVEEKKKKRKKKPKLNIQTIFNIVSFTFILACCIFYGTRLISLYLEHHKPEYKKVLADHIKDNNIENPLFKNINGDYYFEGKENNNYLKYSNLIWRIIKVNNNNTITLVLNNSITALAPGQDKTYKDSYINMWLNNQNNDYTGILESNLSKKNEYLTLTNTCQDVIEDTKNITCKKIISDELIAIPSINDYVNTGGQKGFMNNEENFYLINKNKSNKIWYIDNEGKVNTSDGTDILGIKPTITLNKDTPLINGDGSKENPYIIETENELFGSYVKLGNDIWRIYEVEDEIVKLSLDSYLQINNDDVKYKYSTTGYYHNDTKQGSLAYYLKNTYLPTLSYNNIINETKYANGIYSNVTNFDYREVLKTQVDTKVSVLSIGNIILNSTNTNYYSSTGIAENSNLIYVISNDFKLYTKVDTTNLRVIPVLSINKNLITNGSGTIDSPLEVTYEQ